MSWNHLSLPNLLLRSTVTKLKWKPQGMRSIDVVHLGQPPRAQKIVKKVEVSATRAHSIDLES